MTYHGLKWSPLNILSKSNGFNGVKYGFQTLVNHKPQISYPNFTFNTNSNITYHGLKWSPLIIVLKLYLSWIKITGFKPSFTTNPKISYPNFSIAHSISIQKWHIMVWNNRPWTSFENRFHVLGCKYAVQNPHLRCPSLTIFISQFLIQYQCNNNISWFEMIAREYRFEIEVLHLGCNTRFKPSLTISIPFFSFNTKANMTHDGSKWSPFNILSK